MYSFVNVLICFTVSQTDLLRLDLHLPGELHYYLRASTSQERQQWLVALGSAKACEGITKETAEPVTGPIDGERDILKTKRSELRLYCDLLMQQVHSVKDAATQMPQPDVDVNDYTFKCNVQFNQCVTNTCYCSEIGGIDPFTRCHLRYFHLNFGRLSAIGQS